MKKEELNAIKIRIDKHLNLKSVLGLDMMKLYEAVQTLKNENELLRNNLFDLEQQVPEEQQWQNVIANKLQRALLENDNKEYLEINNSINNDIFTISIQKKFGKTPVQLLKQSEIRRIKASQKIVNLKKQLSDVMQVLSRYKIEVEALNQIGHPKIDEELLVKEKLEITLKALTKVITVYNSTLYRRELPKLHVSMKKILQEATTRAAQAEWNCINLKNEIKKLKAAFFGKQTLICRLYKKRSKRSVKKRRLALHLNCKL